MLAAQPGVSAAALGAGAIRGVGMCGAQRLDTLASCAADGKVGAWLPMAESSALEHLRLPAVQHLKLPTAPWVSVPPDLCARLVPQSWPLPTARLRFLALSAGEGLVWLVGLVVTIGLCCALLRMMGSAAAQQSSSRVEKERLEALEAAVNSGESCRGEQGLRDACSSQQRDKQQHSSQKNIADGATLRMRGAPSMTAFEI